MSNKRITKGEIELCFERFLLDVSDDFFPDPFLYKDLRLMRNEIVNEVKNALIKTYSHFPIIYDVKTHYDWDVPKSNYVVRQGCSFHPYDVIIFHFVLNRLVPIIEHTLSKARYSYRVKNPRYKNIFGNNPTENWIQFRKDIRDYFLNNPDYTYLVTTDVAGFFEYIPIVIFKKQLLQMCNNRENKSIELLSKMLHAYSVSKYSGMPQSCAPFSYLCTAFLDYLDKELEANSIKHFRYVDDIKVACKTKKDAKNAIVQIIRSLRSAHLNLNAAKTDIIPKNSEKFKDFLKEFPPLLYEIDNALSQKQKSKLIALLPRWLSLQNK